MSVSEAAYIDLLEAIPLDPHELLKFKFPSEIQRRISELLELNKKQTLDEEARQELDRYLAAEVVVRVLKAKAIAATRTP